MTALPPVDWIIYRTDGAPGRLSGECPLCGTGGMFVGFRSEAALLREIRGHVRTCTSLPGDRPVWLAVIEARLAEPGPPPGDHSFEAVQGVRSR